MGIRGERRFSSECFVFFFSHTRIFLSWAGAAFTIQIRGVILPSILRRPIVGGVLHLGPSAGETAMQVFDDRWDISKRRESRLE